MAGDGTVAMSARASYSRPTLAPSPALPSPDATAPIVPQRLLRDPWRDGAVLFGAWTLPALAFATATYLGQAGTPASRPWLHFFVLNWPYWLFFAALSPLLYRWTSAVRRPQGTTEAWPVSLARHTAVAVTAAVTVTAGMFFWEAALTDQSIGLTAFRARHVQRPAAAVWQFMNVVAYALAAGSVGLIATERRRQAERDARDRLALHASQLETQLAAARLRMLDMQLNPHFLFNALNSIAALVEVGEQDAAYRGISLLGHLLRMALDRQSAPLVPLREEIEFNRTYLELERLRHASRLNVHYAIDSACADARVPPLILQPLIENVIRHVVARSSRPVSLSVDVRRCGDELALEVRDDGPGRGSEPALPGHGIDNVRARLATLYGDRSRLKFLAAEPHGTIARIELPAELVQTSRGVAT
jgi:signal transduction histidine kinase